MFNPERLLGQLLQSGLGGGLGRSRRRRRGGSILSGMSMGTKAQVGMGLLGVAIAAYEHFKNENESSARPGPRRPSTPPPPTAVTAMPKSSIPTSDAALLVQAMVAAAAADGVIDDAERAQMLKRASDAGFDEETRRFLEHEVAHPKSLDAIAASARPEIAVDLFAASCAAITADTEVERVYLETLAKRLGISDEDKAEVHRQLDLT